MANQNNLIGRGFESRSTEELREIARRGGKKSGEARRKKAEFKKTLNDLLTVEVQNDEWGPTLAAMGLNCTLETIINARMILEAMQGNVKAYEVIAKYSGQDARTEVESEKDAAEMEKMYADIEKVYADTEKTKAETEKAKADQSDQHEEIKITIEAEEAE